MWCRCAAQQNAEGTITFKLVPTESQRTGRENRVRVRALFDFSAAHDRYIPCKEAGLDFRCGDILHIVSQDDPYWYATTRFSAVVLRRRRINLAEIPRINGFPKGDRFRRKC